jgi:hypothetical protein
MASCADVIFTVDGLGKSASTGCSVEGVHCASHSPLITLCFSGALKPHHSHACRVLCVKFRWHTLTLFGFEHRPVTVSAPSALRERSCYCRPRAWKRSKSTAARRCSKPVTGLLHFRCASQKPLAFISITSPSCQSGTGTPCVDRWKYSSSRFYSSSTYHRRMRDTR